MGDFYRKLKKLEKVNNLRQCAINALKYNEKTWFKAFFKIGCMNDMVDNNVNETFNGGS